MLEPTNLPVIKQDIADILNGYLTSGKVEDLYFENFLIN
jgi:flagellar basal body-associated protein FliL